MGHKKIIYKVASCVPCQLYDTESKLTWVAEICHNYRPHVLVTPQEFFGGCVIMPHKKQFTRQEILPELQQICKQYEVALVVGLVEQYDDGFNREVMWFLDHDGTFKGSLVKFALPRYDHFLTGGAGDIVPETNFENRFQTFTLWNNLVVTGMFCWEVYSDVLWTGLGLLKPDIIFSLIKFGPNAWPKVRKQNGVATVKEFGYGTWAEKGQWLERLRMANKWQVKCPIISSTNSWNLRPISMPIAGTISGIPGQAEETLWHPTKEEKLKVTPEKIVVDKIDPVAIRASLMHKFVYRDMVGEFPPFELGTYTMMIKMNRIEDRFATNKEQRAVKTEMRKRSSGPSRLL